MLCCAGATFGSKLPFPATLAEGDVRLAATWGFEAATFRRRRRRCVIVAALTSPKAKKKIGVLFFVLAVCTRYALKKNGALFFLSKRRFFFEPLFCLRRSRRKKFGALLCFRRRRIRYFWLHFSSYDLEVVVGVLIIYCSLFLLRSLRTFSSCWTLLQSN